MRVYGPQSDADKVVFLEELRKVRTHCPGPWCITGDFNLIYNVVGKNNVNINRAMIGRFGQFVTDME